MPCLMPRLATLWQAQRGNVSLTFACATMMLVGAAGSVIDYLHLVNARTAVYSATEATALAAIAAAVRSDQAGRATAQRLGKAAALAMWKANAGSLAGRQCQCAHDNHRQERHVMDGAG